MNFEVEDGSSKSNATSYATVAEFRSFWLDRGTSVTSMSDNEVQGYLNSATEFLDITYDFLGSPSDTDQALSWPRYIPEQTGVQRAVIDTDEIPIEIKNAACWLAYQVSRGTLFPIDKNIIAESYGGVSKTYRDSANRKTYPYLDKILNQYLVISGTPLQRVN